ncbi:hypothetical protein KI387_022564, partial [Taxus chinensis]
MANKGTPKPCKVAVIGAGAAGLVAARELDREGHQIVVFEQSEHVGGTWVYDPHVETDSLGLDPVRTVVHSSMYLSLRTNLPRELMGFLDYPFRVVEGRDCRRFPGHNEVALYLQDFAAEFDLMRFIRFRTMVEYVGMGSNNQWTVRFCADRRGIREEIYDAVVVCNGHHTQPRIAQIPEDRLESGSVHAWLKRSIFLVALWLTLDSRYYVESMVMYQGKTTGKDTFSHKQFSSTL